MHRMGYRCIAAEVRLSPLGIIDAVGTGVFRPNMNYLFVQKELPQACFIECKATRSDFLRDLSDDGQMRMAIDVKAAQRRRRGGRRNYMAKLGKFDSCLIHPMANIHYVLAPPDIVKKDELPARWGLLTLGSGGIFVTKRAGWLETAHMRAVESAIARTLTGDIYRADSRAIDSVNRQIFAQQQQLAERIKLLKPIFAPGPASPIAMPRKRASRG